MSELRRFIGARSPGTTRLGDQDQGRQARGVDGLASVVGRCPAHSLNALRDRHDNSYASR